MEPGILSVDDLIKEGDDVLLYLDLKRSYILKIDAKQQRFHTHKGFIDLSELRGKHYGERIDSSTGFSFYVLKPTIYDYVLRFARHTQILYLKDMSILISHTGIGPGKRVVEAGTGSGALTAMLAYFVRPEGVVYSYEARQEFLEKATKNLERVHLANYVNFINKDVTEGIEQKEADSVILDLATPWLVIPHAHQALRGGGTFASFSPTIDQVMKSVEALKNEGFVKIETLECIVRRINVEPGKTRPETLMIGHTGYLTFARKVDKEGPTPSQMEKL